MTSDEASCEEVNALAREIAGPNASAEIQDLARRVAEAQYELRRVRQARHQLFSGASEGSCLHESRARRSAKIAVLRAVLSLKAPDIPIGQLEQYLTSTTEASDERLIDKYPAILSKHSKDLLALDRYERRALARRKSAIRALDTARSRVSDE